MRKNVLILYAHHDPNSFAKAMLDCALKALAQQEHNTRVSDLHAMKFKAVADDADFITPRPGSGPGSGTDYQSRQRVASINAGYTPDILDELNKLAWADAVIFLFPMYWFHVPAILKGWFDRVFAYDRIYSNEHPSLGAYGKGGLKGKRALIGTTLGASEPRQGAVPSRQSERFEAIQNGLLAYAGFDVMPPFYVWSVAHVSSDRRVDYLNAWKKRVLGLFTDIPELLAADGPSPQPSALRGRVRKPNEKIWPYGGDQTIADFAVVRILKAKPGQASTLLQKLKPLVRAASADNKIRICALLNSLDDKDDIWMIQTFEDMDACKRDESIASMSTLLEEISPLLSRPYEAISLVPKLAKGL
ncbi:NAD(P)H-dependent oxidoreductase [Gluconobacter cerevisiae]|uniref:NAD(P)H-dependent oxidoreductase n=1 Tax=Gluconobacter cerevisiae TaxID=1379734 RepID=A0ABR9YGI1_9PROT|nr:NAD(P)H-dependent oxidoreductase [Gluconobacter cerevisiae]MBF0877190.1 NAD(P)H-dependent oxidoreductase [Gluconobacter cerevisiae]